MDDIFSIGFKDRKRKLMKFAKQNGQYEMAKKQRKAFSAMDGFLEGNALCIKMWLAQIWCKNENEIYVEICVFIAANCDTIFGDMILLVDRIFFVLFHSTIVGHGQCCRVFGFRFGFRSVRSGFSAIRTENLENPFLSLDQDLVSITTKHANIVSFFYIFIAFLTNFRSISFGKKTGLTSLLSKK